MSAKPSKKSAKPAVTPSPRATPAAVSNPPVPTPRAAETAATVTPEPSAWLDSADPRKRLLGKCLLAGVWLYVAALWLLALDQTFHWGLFGPKLPPVP